MRLEATPARDDARSALAGAVVALLAMGATVLWANLVTPLWGDDWCRAGLPNVGEAISATAREYGTWTGRVAPTLLTYLALGPLHLHGLPWFEIANTGAFLLVVVLSVRLVEFATGRRATEGAFAHAFVTWSAACLAIWWLPRTIGEVALWKTGAIGYVWAAALALVVVERALALAASPKPPRHLVTGALALVAFAGATFLEPLSVLTAGLLALVAFHAIRRAAPARRALLVLAGAQAAGTLVLLAAPGNFRRASTAQETSLLSRLDGWIGFAGNIFDPLWILAVVLLAVAWWPPRAGLRGGSLIGALPWAAAAPFCAVALAYLLILLPLPRETLAARVSFPASVALACGLLVSIVARPRHASRDMALAVAFGFLFVIQVVVLVRDLPALAAPQRAWLAVVAAAPPDVEIEVPIVRARGRTWLARKHRFFIGIGPDPAAGFNLCFARAMGVRAVRGF